MEPIFYAIMLGIVFHCLRKQWKTLLRQIIERMS